MDLTLNRSSFTITNREAIFLASSCFAIEASMTHPLYPGDPRDCTLKAREQLDIVHFTCKLVGLRPRFGGWGGGGGRGGENCRILFGSWVAFTWVYLA